MAIDFIASDQITRRLESTLSTRLPRSARERDLSPTIVFILIIVLAHPPSASPERERERLHTRIQELNGEDVLRYGP